MIDWLAPRPGMRLLDVAGGTGDIAFRFLDRVKGDGARHRARHDRGHADRGPRGGPRRRPTPARSTGWSATRWRCPSPTRASTPTRSPSASGTSPGSRTRWPRPTACCGPAGGSSCSSSAAMPEREPALALRPLFLQRHPADGPGARRRPRRATSISSNRSAASPTRRPSPAMIARGRLRAGPLSQPLDGHRGAALGLEALRHARAAQSLAPDPHRRDLRAHRRDGASRSRRSTRRRRCGSRRGCSAGRSSGSGSRATRRSRRSCGR